jgi:YD repeat-containing protein
MTDFDFQDRPIAEEQTSATASSAAAGVASGLRILRGLGYAANFGRRNSCSPTFILGRTHALIGHVAGGGRRWKLSRATHGQRVARRFNMSGSRIQLAHAVDFLAHSFERCSEHLFALQGMLRCARKASTSGCSFSAHGSANLARQRAFLIAHTAQTPLQRLKVISSGIVDFGMVATHDEFMFIVAENAALEFAGYGHVNLNLYAVAASCCAATRFFVHARTYFGLVKHAHARRRTCHASELRATPSQISWMPSNTPSSQTAVVVRLAKR